MMVAFKNGLFRWDEIPGKDNERLIEFLKHNYDPKLSRTAKIYKSDANTIKISDGKSSIFLVLNAEKSSVDVKIDGRRTDEFDVSIEEYKKENKYLFCWDKIPEDNNRGEDDERLGDFLRQNFGVDWIKSAKIEKIDDNTIKISTEKNLLLLKLNTERTKVNLTIDDGRTDEFIAKIENGKLNIYNNKKHNIYPKNPVEGPGRKFVGSTGIILTTAYFFLLFILLVYSLVQFWPSQTLGEGSKSISSVALSSALNFPVSDEGQLFIIVAVAGALGSLVHALRSFYWYVGHRGLIISWLAMYMLLPTIGAMLGLIFYITLRGGLFPQATVQQTSPFGFAALSALVGLFSVEAVMKLQSIAETVFTKAGEGQESRPQERGKGNT